MPLRCSKPTTAGALFRRYDETDDQAMKQGIVVELFVELELHTQLEEAVFSTLPSQTRPTGRGKSWSKQALKPMRRSMF